MFVFTGQQALSVNKLRQNLLQVLLTAPSCTLRSTGRLTSTSLLPIKAGDRNLHKTAMAMRIPTSGAYLFATPGAPNLRPPAPQTPAPRPRSWSFTFLSTHMHTCPEPRGRHALRAGGGRRARHCVPRATHEPHLLPSTDHAPGCVRCVHVHTHIFTCTGTAVTGAQGAQGAQPPQRSAITESTSRRR
jgi:hypothetical protein